MSALAYDKKVLSLAIQAKAKEEGFLGCGISKADLLENADQKLSEWLNRKFHGEMEYMQRNREKRADPRKLVPGARSVISFLYNYYPAKDISKSSEYKISKYAWGRDYHFVIKRKLKEIMKMIRQSTGLNNHRVFVDSAPVMDKVWAERSGLGWIGKNTCLLNRKHGSFFFIGEIITEAELLYDEQKQHDLCGSCTRCLRACPTGALTQAYMIDANKCISYLTIEYKKETLPEHLKENFNGWIFGCDICQDVCPWNRMSEPHREAAFEPGEQLKQMTSEDWEKLDKETFNKIFKHSAVKRTKYSGLKRNIRFVAAKDLPRE